MNPYTRLGVPQDADAKAIKKAYVVLIRQFPPETHEAEFKEIRAAYELLSDPDARARFDAENKSHQELSEIEVQALAITEELLKKGQTEDAIKVLRQTLARKWDSKELRQRLALLLMQAGQAAEALPFWEELSRMKQEHAPTWANLGFCRMVEKKFGESAQAFEQAIRLDSNHFGYRMMLVDCWVEAGKKKEAFQQLEEAQGIANDWGKQMMLEEKRVFIHFWRGRERDMLGHLLVGPPPRTGHGPEALARLCALQDPATKKEAARRLGSVAALLLRNRQQEEAAIVLTICQRLSPQDPLLCAPAARYELGWAQVPPALRAWLEEPHPELPQQPYKSPQVTDRLTLGLGALVTGFFGLGFSTSDSLLLVVLFLPIATILALAAIEWEPPPPKLHPPLRLILHPCYLLQALPDRLVLWPWLSLEDIKLLNRNGNIDVTFQFGGIKMGTGLGLEANARRWMNATQFFTSQMLQAMIDGVLEAVPGMDHAPMGLLPAKADIPKPHSRKYGKWVIGAAQALLILFLSPRQMEVEAASEDPAVLRHYAYEHPVDTTGASERAEEFEKEQFRFLLETLDTKQPGAEGLRRLAKKGIPIPVVMEGGGTTIRELLEVAASVRGTWLKWRWIGPRVKNKERGDRIEIHQGDSGWTIEVVENQIVTWSGHGKNEEELVALLGLGTPAPWLLWEHGRSADKNPYLENP